MFPSRDEVVAHIDRHAHEDGIELRLDTAVNRIDRARAGWRLDTSTGDIEARQVVVATGYMHSPYVPEWQGKDRFAGDLLHSADYRNPTPYAGKQALVVGAGSSGMEIAHDLATGGAAKVWMAVRTPPNIFMRGGPGGVPGDVIATPLYHLPPRIADAISGFARRRIVGELTDVGLPIPEEGTFSRLARLGVAPAIVDLEVIAAIRDGSIEIVRAVESFDETAVSLADGRTIQPDAVICATGYLRGLEPLVGHLSVLDERGLPPTKDGQPAASGLRFLGFVPRPSLIGAVAKRSKRMAKEIAADLHGR